MSHRTDREFKTQVFRVHVRVREWAPVSGPNLSTGLQACTVRYIERDRVLRGWQLDDAERRH